MRIYFLLALVFSSMFSCVDKKEVLLSERMELFNWTIESNNFSLNGFNEQLFSRLNHEDQIRLDTIRRLSTAITDYLNHLRNDMVNASGGIDSETNLLVNQRDFEFCYEFIMQSTYKESFKDTVNSISILISDLEIFDVPAIVFDSKADPYWSLSPEQKQISAIQLLFEKANLPSALATISLLHGRVLEYERKAYETILFQELDSLREINK